jgi:hypothetical protein
MKLDWTGKWFQILAERGHSDWLPFFEMNLVTGEVTDMSFHHREKDGAVVMTKLMEKWGVPALAFKPMLRPSFFQLIVLFFKGLKSNADMVKPRWKTLDVTRTDKAPVFVWLLFKDRANSALLAHAKAKRLSPNALVMQQVAQHVSRHTMTAGGGSWMMPVNMRGAFPEAPMSGIQVSYLPITITPETSAADVHNQMKTAFRDGAHWQNWAVSQIGRVVGLSGMRYLSKQSSKRAFWVGTYSDLGDWTPSGVELPAAMKQLMWVATLPGSPNNPVGCACATWNGKRSMGLRLHPSICPVKNTQLTREILTELVAVWVRELGVDTSDFEIFEIPTPGPEPKY